MDSENFVTSGVRSARAADGRRSAGENKTRLDAVSILFAAAGLTLIVKIGSGDAFRDVEKTFTNGVFCLPLAVGAALLLVGIFIGTRWKTFAGWTALALIGQAASLQMIDAGRLIHFQHYRSFSELLNRDVAPLILLALQIVLVFFGVAKHLPAIKNRLKQTFKTWQLILIALFLSFSGAAVTKDVYVYGSSLLIAAVVQTVNLANAALLVCSVPTESLGWQRGKLAIFFGEKTAEKPRLDEFALSAAFLVVVVAATLSYFVYENHPHVPDETQYLFQAKYMAAGRLTVKAPLVPEAFAMYMTPRDEARWFGIFPPAYPALLAVGLKLNAVWLVNPLLAGLCVLLAYLFFWEIYSRSFARVAVVLLACSPWFVFMAMSFMSHVFTLACALGAAVLLRRAFRNGKIALVFSSGLLIGVVSLIRPLDGAIVAALLGVWTLFGFETWTKKITNGLALVAGTVASAALVFPYNKSVTGSATSLPMDFYYTKYFWADVMALGFGANRGMDWGLDAFPGHSPLEAVVNAALNTFSLNTELFGWATGSLILVACFLFSGALRKKDVWALAAIAGVVGAYGFYWYHGGPDFGARYWFLIIIPLVALSVRAIERFSQKPNETGGDFRSNPRVVVSVAALCALSLFNYLPWRAADKYHRYLEMQPGVERLARENNFGRSLVLIRGAEHPDYQSAWTFNPLDFEGDAPIYAWDKNPAIRARLLQAYSDRPVWTVDGPTLSGGEYKITRRAASAFEMLAEMNR